ncbi:hypothetical protein [Nitrososphaera sp.]|uniref:hypothetical protein n=1 Tax=Nitrososphaera sp. TaxID=1971748 RepID=UPI002EDB01A5
MAELIEQIFSGILASATVALAVATFYLAKNTRAVTQLTQASIRASEALQTMPSLTFNGAQPLSDGGGKYSTFSVKNVGYGHAKKPTVLVRTKDGRGLEAKPHFKTNIIEVDNLFYWNVYDVKVGDELSIEVSFTDIRDVPYPAFKHTYTVI